MKGDNLKVKLTIFGLGYNSFYQADIYIHDCNNNLILKKRTYNSMVDVKLKKNKLYKITIKTLFEEKNVSIYINNNHYCISLNSNLINIVENQTITFQLTDYYYNNLKVERGELILWPR